MEETAAAPLVLVVDDFREAREMYAMTLEIEGFRVAQASSAEQAIDMAGALKPKAILMDLSLPGLDGIEATRRLKADVHTRDIPVLAISGRTAEAVAEAARDAGCHGFVLRPTPVATVIDEIRRLVQPGMEPRS